MKKLQILFAVFFLLFLSACGKLPMNGQLDGMWQLMSITPHGKERVDTKEHRLYYSIQLELLALQRGGGMHYLGRFIQSPDSLVVYDFRLHVTGNNSTQAVSGDLVPWGIEGTSERFGIEKLDGDHMVLRSENVLLTFKKF